MLFAKLLKSNKTENRIQKFLRCLKCVRNVGVDIIQFKEGQNRKE